MTDEPATNPFDAAADWLLRLRAAPADVALAQEFARWLEVSPEHRLAFERAERSWQLLGEIGTAPVRSGARPRMRAAVAASLALAACIILVLALPALRLQMEADHRTGTGGQRLVALEDGSRVELGADSAIAVDLKPDRRSVRLLAGEAYFDVRPEPSRPFVVEAGGLKVEVLGTAFNVRLSSNATNVELERGAVELAFPDHSGAGARLAPGQTALFDRSTGSVVIGTIAPDDIAAWRSGRLFVQDVTIAAVVEQLQRYHHGWIGVVDGAIAAQRVTGLYDLSDPDRALRALVQPYGGRVLEISPYVRVLARF